MLGCLVGRGGGGGFDFDVDDDAAVVRSLDRGGMPGFCFVAGAGFVDSDDSCTCWRDPPPLHAELTSLISQLFVE